MPEGGKPDETSAIWGGRFASAPDALFFAYGRSVQWDSRLWPEDIEGSIAHAAGLVAAGVLGESEGEALLLALQNLQQRLEAGEPLPIVDGDEDVHGAIERILGAPGGYLHAGRSRNDQVALDFHLYCKRRALGLAEQTKALQGSVLAQAKANSDKVVPGYTHLQQAQPVLLAQHLMAYFWMFERDRRRLLWAAASADRSPLGAGALAGAGLPLPSAETARRLGFAGVYDNSIDAVSDRDFALDLGHAAAVAALHLSRLGEEIVLWSTREFGWIELPDSFATGSSMMPQKKNPDAAELLRGRSGRVLGRHFGLMVMLKGLPLAYVRDLQEDKEALFEIVDTTTQSLGVAAAFVAALRFTPPEIPYGDLIVATDLADHLVRCGVPFRAAHRIVGQAVRLAAVRGGSFAGLSDQDWQDLSPHFDRAALAGLLEPRAAVTRRDVAGGTAPARVEEQIRQAEQLLARD